MRESSNPTKRFGTMSSRIILIIMSLYSYCCRRRHRYRGTASTDSCFTCIRIIIVPRHSQHCVPSSYHQSRHMANLITLLYFGESFAFHEIYGANARIVLLVVSVSVCVCVVTSRIRAKIEFLYNSICINNILQRPRHAFVRIGITCGAYAFGDDFWQLSFNSNSTFSMRQTKKKAVNCLIYQSFTQRAHDLDVCVCV